MITKDMQQKILSQLHHYKNKGLVFDNKINNIINEKIM